MQIDNAETKANLIQRLKRIEGQVRGIQNMINDERDCQEIMQQLTAIHSAVQSTSRIFLQDYALTCMANIENHQTDIDKKTTQRKMIQDMIVLLDKTP